MIKKTFVAALFCFAPTLALAGNLNLPPLTGDVHNGGYNSTTLTISNGAVKANNMATGAAVGNIGFTPLNPANNLADVSSAATARANIGAAASGVNGDLTALNAISTISMSALGTIAGPLSTSVSGIWQTAGSGVSLCNLAVNCAAWPNMTFGASSAQILNTTGNASEQENNGNFYMTVGTGLETTWAQSTNYVAGQIVDTGTYTYTETVASCTSASTGTGPSGQSPTPQPDGTCSWTYLGSQGLGVKNNLNVQTNVLPGGGRAWNATFGLHVYPGWTAPAAFNMEMDAFNGSSIDPTIGSAYKIVDLLMEGSGGANPITAMIHIAPSSPGSHEGIWFSGNGITDHTISDGTQSTISYWDTGTHSVAGFVEKSTSPVGVLINGVQTNGIQLSGTFSGTAIALTSTPGNNIGVGMLQGTKVCLSVNTQCILSDGTEVLFSATGLKAQGDVVIAEPTSTNSTLYFNTDNNAHSWRVAALTGSGNLNFADATSGALALQIQASPLANAVIITPTTVQIATAKIVGDLAISEPSGTSSTLYLTTDSNAHSWRMLTLTGSGNLNIADAISGNIAMQFLPSPLASALVITPSGVQLATVAVGSTLPTCNTGANTSEVNISNANVNTWGSAITAGGSFNVRARCNGTNWTVLGI